MGESVCEIGPLNLRWRHVNRIDAAPVTRARGQNVRKRQVRIASVGNPTGQVEMKPGTPVIRQTKKNTRTRMLLTIIYGVS